MPTDYKSLNGLQTAAEVKPASIPASVERAIAVQFEFPATAYMWRECRSRNQLPGRCGLPRTTRAFSRWSDRSNVLATSKVREPRIPRLRNK